MHHGTIPNQVRLGWGLLLLIIAAVVQGLLIPGLEARIAIYGDTRGGEEVHASIVQALTGLAPDLVFHTGDLSSHGRSPQEFEVFKAIIEPLGSVDFYPVRGNHERDEKLLLSYFPQLQGSTRYIVRRDSLVFVALDSTHDLKPGSEQFNWLKENLLAHQDRPIILLMHHPVFSSGAHGDELGLSLWLPHLLEGSSVKAVISGHEHSYERSEFGGIHYLVSGGGGAPFRTARNPNPHSKLFVISHHFLILDPEATKLKVRVLTPDLNLLDSFDIEL